MKITRDVIEYEVLKHFDERIRPGNRENGVYVNSSKIETLLPGSFWEDIKGKTILDFGCGDGSAVIEIAQRGASKVIGLDIQERLLDIGRQKAERAGVSDRCFFTTHSNQRADIIISMDAFEHFNDPGSILQRMYELLEPNGCVYVAFGPPWFHPLGGHLFSIFPYAHLLFTESALIRWRSDFKQDGATRFHEIEGGLNRMTIRRFKALLKQSQFQTVEFEAIPIKRLKFIANRWTQELTTSVVRCRLIPER